MKLKYLAMVIAVALLLFMAGCAKKAPAAPETPTAPAAPTTAPAATTPAETAPAEGTTPEEAEGVTPVPETEPGPGLVTTEALDTGEYTQQSLIGNPQNKDESLARDYTGEPVRFSNFECTKDETTGVRYISVKLTNTNTAGSFMISAKGIAKGYNTYFMMRGMVDENPGCEVEELAPGESVVCSKIGKDDMRYGNVAGTNRLTIESPGNDGKKVTEAVVVNCPE
jgi:hypothetical protein